MSASTWVTKADVLKDIGQHEKNETNLEQFVVEGDRAPPIRQEVEDEDEMQYHFGPSYNTPVEVDHSPDLKGISLMLQMVNNPDHLPESDKPKTIFRDSQTDEISISKLNPNVSEFVPSGGWPSKPQTIPKTPKKSERIKLKKPMLIRKSDKVKGSKENVGTSVIVEKDIDNALIVQTQQDKQNNSCNNLHINSSGTTSSSTINGYPKRKIEKKSLSNSSSTSVEATTNASLNEKMSETEMIAAEIDFLKREVRSKILMSSKDNSMKRKSERNVAMATLMKLCAAPPVAANAVESPVKLVTPQYFEAPACDEENTKIRKEIKEEPDVPSQIYTTSTAELAENKLQYVDPIVKESISKVNNWFNNAGPKPKLPAPPVPLQDALAFKKKFTSSTSVNSPTTNSETSSEKKKTSADFRPSEYAKDLLSKYEKNAEYKVALKEDLGTMLERKLKEKDQQIKEKMLGKKNGASPSSERGIH